MSLLPDLKKEKRQSDNGNNDTVNGSGNNVSDGDTSNSDVSSTSNTHGLSQSDKIAIGVGVPTGVVTVIGVVLTYLGIRRRKEWRLERELVESHPLPSRQAGSSSSGPHNFSVHQNELP